MHGIYLFVYLLYEFDNWIDRLPMAPSPLLLIPFSMDLFIHLANSRDTLMCLFSSFIHLLREGEPTSNVLRGVEAPSNDFEGEGSPWLCT